MSDYTDTDKAVLELTSTLHDLAGFTNTLVHDKGELWVTAIYEAIELLKTHAGDTDLVGA
jgi:hypothetical protein